MVNVYTEHFRHSFCGRMILSVFAMFSDSARSDQVFP